MLKKEGLVFFRQLSSLPLGDYYVYSRKGGETNKWLRRLKDKLQGGESALKTLAPCLSNSVMIYGGGGR